MPFQAETYNFKPASVKAVRITPENMLDVAEWCGGKILPGTHKTKIGKACVKINTLSAKSVRYSEAYAGDWLVLNGSTFLVYVNTAFHKNFEKPIQIVVNP